jgi:CRISPR-associated helicase Cas3/CRISPR-associated endonuclease Cas3-HD
MSAFYAHSVQGKGKERWQLLREHLEQTALISEVNATKFGAGEFGKLAGILHDIGKYSSEFQERLNGTVGVGKVDHSTAGAKEAVSLSGRSIGRLLAYVVAGHHTGLPNGGPQIDEASLDYRLKRDLLDYSNWQKELPRPVSTSMRLPIRPIDKASVGFSVAFFTRMLYSCLADADFLDTESHLAPEMAAQRGHWPTLTDISIRLDKYMAKKRTEALDTLVNRWRQEILEHCRQEAERPPGLFTLTVPTGGGKTLSSLSFALRHALRYGLERVIYVIPFTSIIEQNAAVFRSAVGKGATLEHHCNFQFDGVESEDPNDASEKFRLSTQNWDAPLIVTTNVQFFESLFANRSSKCRKLHNLARSVIILDEAQMIPTDLLRPCLRALIELAANYGTSVVLCTATQPALTGLLPREFIPIELAPNPVEIYEALRRVEVIDRGTMSDVQLSNELLSHKQALCIVNTRRHAKILYELMRSDEDVYHLSARMCPIHRKKRLEAIRKVLSGGQACRLVSTQLIEAGVDVDFPVVYRSAAGLDSIAQAAGRCNREGRMENGRVNVFRPEKHGLPGGWFSRTADIAGMVMRDFPDPLDLAAIHSYFTFLYGLDAKDLDKKGILQMFRDGERDLSFPFREVADQFHLIDHAMTTIVVPWDSAAEALIRQAEHTRYPASLERDFQPYAVQVYRQELAELLTTGAVGAVANQYYVLLDMSLYEEGLGLLPARDSAQVAGEGWIF